MATRVKSSNPSPSGGKSFRDSVCFLLSDRGSSSSRKSLVGFSPTEAFFSIELFFPHRIRIESGSPLAARHRSDFCGAGQIWTGSSSPGHDCNRGPRVVNLRYCRHARNGLPFCRCRPRSVVALRPEARETDVRLFHVMARVANWCNLGKRRAGPTGCQRTATKSASALFREEKRIP